MSDKKFPIFFRSKSKQKIRSLDDPKEATKHILQVLQLPIDPHETDPANLEALLKELSIAAQEVLTKAGWIKERTGRCFKTPVDRKRVRFFLFVVRSFQI